MARRYRSYSTKPLPLRPPRVIYTLMRKWQVRLGLQHWGVINLYVRPFKDATAAEIKWTRDYKGASISFSHKWLVSEHTSYDDYEATVVHELCHLLFAAMDDRLERYLGLGEVFFEYGETREGMCDMISNLLIQRYKRVKK